MTLRKSWPAILAIGAPLIIVTVTAVAVLGPQLALRPQGNFVYNIQEQGYGYPMAPMQLVQTEYAPPPPPPQSTVKTYIYDFKTGTSSLVANPNADQPDPGSILLKQPVSPDGYVVEPRSSYSGNIFSEMFGGGDNGTKIFLVKNGNSKKLNISLIYNQSFSFVGWESPLAAYGKK